MVVRAFLALLFLACSAQAADEALPFVGNRVRVMAPRASAGWQVGMFNQLQVEPPCYRVLLFQGTRVAATLSARDIERLQVSVQPDGRNRNYRPRQEASEEQWREVPMAALRAAEDKCPVAH